MVASTLFSNINNIPVIKAKTITLSSGGYAVVGVPYEKIISGRIKDGSDDTNAFFAKAGNAVVCRLYKANGTIISTDGTEVLVLYYE